MKPHIQSRDSRKRNTSREVALHDNRELDVLEKGPRFK